MKRWSVFGWAIRGVSLTLEEEPRSSEAAQQTVSNNLGMASDAGLLSVVALLDLNGKNILPRSTLWQSVPNAALISWDHISQNAFNWLISIHFQNVTVNCGVPQGSILGWSIFNVYMLPLGRIIRTHNVDLLSYADDTLLYLSIKLHVSGQWLELKIYLKDIQIMDDSRFPNA